ncbi:MAG TPA: protein kinase [Candidatus Limnocylindrales bacterium]|nr:protein kinase [Candidatus Limnocylindrales bacterium]
MTIEAFITAKSKGRYQDITEMHYEEGGFGRLYKAKDSHRNGAEVCIKVIKPNLPRDLQLKLWQDEVRALSKYARRSNIANLVDKPYEFTDQDPYLFFVMEYVHGDRLGSSKYKIELNLEQDLAVLALFQLCSAVYSIHQRGEYHQDIFPDNIKMDGDNLILLDMGGMREAARRSGTVIFGGEIYSAPEVSPTRLRIKKFRTLRKSKMGSFETADIFSIGAIFYEMITGKTFFDNPDESNQLKEFIYDYYAELPEITPPAGVDIKTHKAELIKQLIKMKQEYGSIIRKYVQRMENYKNFLDKQGFSQTLAELLTNTLSIFPPERPKAEEILTALFSYLMKQAKKHFSKGDWEAALRDFKHLERHFDEIALESEDEDPLFRERMIRHLQTHLDLYLKVCLGSGATLFHSGSFTLARDKFLKAETILMQQSQVLSVKARETYILKIRNNLAACTFMSGQIKKATEEFERLLKAVEGTSPIVRNNLAVCARYQ